MINSFTPFKIFTIEIWKEHPTYSNYEASNYGNIRKKGCNNIKQTLTSWGYLHFTLSVMHKHRTIMSHRFIWECWNGPIPKGMEIDHIDTIKSNNELSNLRLGTHKENTNNSLTLEKYRKRKFTEEVKKKIGEKQKLPIIQCDKNGTMIKEYSSIREAAKEIGVYSPNITACLKGKRKSLRGFVWKYKEKERA